MTLDFADRLGFAIARAGVERLSDLAARVKAAPGTVTRYLNVRKTRPDGLIVDNLASVLGVEPRWLGQGRGAMLADGTPGPDYVGDESLEETLRVFPRRWSEKTIEQARLMQRYKDERLGLARKDANGPSWRDALDAIREMYGQPGYFSPGRPPKTPNPPHRTDLVVVPDSDAEPPLARQETVERVARMVGATPTAVTYKLAEAAKGGVSGETHRRVAEDLGAYAVKPEKRTRTRATSKENAAAVDASDGGKSIEEMLSKRGKRKR